MEDSTIMDLINTILMSGFGASIKLEISIGPGAGSSKEGNINLNGEDIINLIKKSLSQKKTIEGDGIGEGD